jgi:hypothetical protein
VKTKCEDPRTFYMVVNLLLFWSYIYLWIPYLRIVWKGKRHYNCICILWAVDSLSLSLSLSFSLNYQIDWYKYFQKKNPFHNNKVRVWFRVGARVRDRVILGLMLGLWLDAPDYSCFFSDQCSGRKSWKSGKKCEIWKGRRMKTRVPWNGVCRRIELFLREIIRCFEIILQNVLFSWHFHSFL